MLRSCEWLCRRSRRPWISDLSVGCISQCWGMYRLSTMRRVATLSTNMFIILQPVFTLLCTNKCMRGVPSYAHFSTHFAWSPYYTLCHAFLDPLVSCIDYIQSTLYTRIFSLLEILFTWQYNTNRVCTAIVAILKSVTVPCIYILLQLKFKFPCLPLLRGKSLVVHWLQASKWINIAFSSLKQLSCEGHLYFFVQSCDQTTDHHIVPREEGQYRAPMCPT